MAPSLAAALAGLGALDALNPFSIAALAYLLATPASFARSTTFVAGTFLTYLAGGIVLVRGLGFLRARILPGLPGWIVPVGMLGLGVVCLVLSIVTWRRARVGKPAFTPPGDLSVGATALFAVGSTASDIPTGAPYIAAASRIAGATDDLARQLLWLGFYNLVYTSPLIALLALHAALGARAEPLFDRIQNGIDRAFARLTPLLLLGLGAWLTSAAVARFANTP